MCLVNKLLQYKQSSKDKFLLDLPNMILLSYKKHHAKGDIMIKLWRKPPW